MEKVGIGVVSYGSREACMVDVFSRSPNYDVELYVADRQKNPFNFERATIHKVIPSLDVNELVKFFENYKNDIDFVICGCEDPIINGFGDLLGRETKIPAVCPAKEYAIEGSKVAQRLLLDRVAPETNPMFKIFDPKDYKTDAEVVEDAKVWIEELGGVAYSVIKPDRPGRGKGVGVGGEHFFTMEEALQHFFSIYGNRQEKVIVEERIEGEESSLQAFCDGRHYEILPETRDYKRAYEDDKGPNTGGMGSYKAKGDMLPFMKNCDREIQKNIVAKLFKELAGDAGNLGLIGMPFYIAFVHTAGHPKILEINSRPGDPEIQNILPILKDDFVDVCIGIVSESLKKIELESSASVATYLVPDVYPQKDDKKRRVDLSRAYELNEKYGDKIRIYPSSMELRGGETYALASRTVCTVGIGDDIETAREISLDGIAAVEGESLRYRKDIASEEHINKSVCHMKRLRRLIV